ncbi:MAG: 50S ribosomal protein L29 [Syntrophales bacterium]
MKIKEVRDLSSDELQQKNRELVEELFRLRLRHAAGQLDSPAVLGRLRRDIARIKTVLVEKEVARGTAQ